MPILIDTDVLIDYLRNREEAVLFLESSNELMLLSVITIAELYAGTREGSEREKRLRSPEGFIAASTERVTALALRMRLSLPALKRQTREWSH